MRVKFGPLISEATGSLGSSLFRSFNGRSYVTMKPRPLSHQSPTALYSRSALARVSNAWRELSTSDKASWHVLASSLRAYSYGFRNAPTSGRHAFISYHLPFATSNVTPLVDPPSARTAAILYTVTPTYSLATGLYTLVQSYPGFESGNVWLWAARSFQDTPRPVRNWTFIHTQRTGGGSYFILTTQFTNLLGTPSVGEAIQLRYKFKEDYSYYVKIIEVTIYVTA